MRSPILSRVQEKPILTNKKHRQITIAILVIIAVLSLYSLSRVDDTLLDQPTAAERAARLRQDKEAAATWALFGFK